MFQLRVLSGRREGEVCRVDRFPFVIGRGAGADWQLAEPGIWDRHATIELTSEQTVRIAAAAEAAVQIDGEPAGEGILRNGAILGVGSIRMSFVLAPAAIRGGDWRARMLGALVMVALLAQIAAMFLLR